MNKPKWKRFEEVVFEIQKSFANDAEVKFDDKIDGQDSKTKRQVDISIKKHIAQYPIFIAIECKDIKDPVDVTEIESFCTKIKDIRANRGVMISSSGFTKAALKTAKIHAIDAYRLIDTKSIDWKVCASIPALLIRVFPRKYNLLFKGVGPIQNINMDTSLFKIYDKDGAFMGTAHNLIKKYWNDRKEIHEPGIKEIMIGENLLIDIGDQRIKATILGKIDVAKEYYFGYWPIDLQGFKDEQTGHVITKEMLSSNISPHEIETGQTRGWSKIDNPEQLSVQLGMSMQYSDVYPVDNESSNS